MTRELVGCLSYLLGRLVGSIDRWMDQLQQYSSSPRSNKQTRLGRQNGVNSIRRTQQHSHKTTPLSPPSHFLRLIHLLYVAHLSYEYVLLYSTRELLIIIDPAMVTKNKTCIYCCIYIARDNKERQRLKATETPAYTSAVLCIWLK